jgi:hypothetical protein
MTSLGPETKTPLNHNQQGSRTLHKIKQNTSKPDKNWPAPTRPKDTRVQQITQDKSHRGLTLVRPVKSTGQTGGAWAARDEQNPRVNSSKSNSRSPNSLHKIEQDFEDSRNTSWALHSQVMVHQNLLDQEESEDFRQEHHKPLTNETPKIEPLFSGIWERNQREKNHEGFMHISPNKS